MIISTGQRLTPARLSIPTGQASVSFTAQTSFDVTVSFGWTFAANPRVLVNIANTAGVTANWSVRAHTVTTTGFILRAWGPSSQTWSGVPVTWVAIPA